MEVSSIFQLPEELLILWHLHRAEILISAGILVAILRFALLHRKNAKPNEKLQVPSQPTRPSQPEAKNPPDRNPILDPIQPIAATAPLSSRISARRAPRRIQGTKKPLKSRTDLSPPISAIQPIIFYFTLGGATKAYAEILASSLTSSSSAGILPPRMHDLAEIEYEEFFLAAPAPATRTTGNFYLLLIPGYNIDTELSNFLSHLRDTHHDFRVDSAPLAALAGFGVFGFGDRTEWPTEREGFGAQAVEVDRWMAKLTGGKRAFPLGMGDVMGKGTGDVKGSLGEWTTGVVGILRDLSEGKGLGDGVPGSGDAVESGDEEGDEEDEGERGGGTTTVDLEDLKAPIPVDFTTSSPLTSAPKAMVPITSPTYASLKKQGYTIVGTHSGVKICRWTKSALRGRGSCYKFSFYGIASHQCMEATPSLSCSNKCVFCWRHGTNPVGTTWRWQVDPPEQIFDGIKAGHYQKIKMLRGVPGVRSERFAEAMRIRHCALSLVGEPIFYPHIDALLAMLHREHISSFLVCNAQHPDQLAALGPVTQLYVSIDAADKASLRAIDRPLHRDFWERFLRCMDILYTKRNTHRTVFRLTLVKGFNASPDAIAGYADLVERAAPSFVEVKGVTFCGTTTAAGAGLTMANVPFYEEVKEFVEGLQMELGRRGVDYGVGAEHAHSCCILLADPKRYRRMGADGQLRWHTLIDYPKFFACLESGRRFGPEDYVSDTPTPEWALWGNGGFDPRDQRVDRKGRPKAVEVSKE